MNFFDSIKNSLIGFFDNHFTKRSQFIGDPNHLDENYKAYHNEASTLITGNLIQNAYKTDIELLSDLNSRVDGLTIHEVDQRIAKYGFNQVEEDKRLTWYKHLILSYKNPFNLLLTILAIVSYLTDDMAGTTIIGLMVLISTVLRFVGERKSNNAADKLKSMVSTTATVLRKLAIEDTDSETVNVVMELHEISRRTVEVPIRELVPGDVLKLSAGDMIPADVRILASKDLFISQASLTGESLPVEKFSIQAKSGVKDALELESIGFMGTNVVSGTATAIVLTTGKNTLFGALADKVLRQDYIETSFQKGVNKVSWLLIYFMLIMAPIVLLINGFTKHDWVSAALFALSIAVGLTPEMLPMIVTSTLAKGAVFMSRRKVIVKRLDAIQNFGAMDILCTDKTGTLTQDKICLEKHTNIFGQDYDDVLEYAYLNSYYQTGLKNLLDVAVLERANFGDIPELVRKYKKVDEVPFDFKRRRMSVVVAAGDTEHILVCKGAVEEMLNCCTMAALGDEVMPLTPDLLAKIQDVTGGLNADGLRVVAVAIKHYLELKPTYTVSDEYDMILVGYIAFLDPPKETTRPAIEALNKLGIGVKILTGDNELVTVKVCREVGLNVEGLLLGSQIDELSDHDLLKFAESTTVFAKLTPSHKERIVEVLHNKGHVVGFMGDGINDAPALAAATVADWPGASYQASVEESYRNMKDVLDQHPMAADCAREAISSRVSSPVDGSNGLHSPLA